MRSLSERCFRPGLAIELREVVAKNIQSLKFTLLTNCETRKTVNNGECLTYQRQLLRQRRILLSLVADLEIRVRLPGLVRILIPEPAEVLSRHGIDDFEIDLAANLGVFVEDRVVCQTLVDAQQTVKETAHVGNSSGETKAATKVTLLLVQEPHLVLINGIY